MCALGVSAVPGADAMRIPFRPYVARKHAKDAPAGPAPTMRKSVSTGAGTDIAKVEMS